MWMEIEASDPRAAREGRVERVEFRPATQAEYRQHVSGDALPEFEDDGETVWVPVHRRSARRARALVSFDEAAARDWLSRDAGDNEDDGGGDFEARYLDYLQGPEALDEHYISCLVHDWSDRGGFGSVRAQLAVAQYHDGQTAALVVLVDINPTSAQPLRVGGSWVEARKVDGLSVDVTRPSLDRLAALLAWVASEVTSAVGVAFAAIDEL